MFKAIILKIPFNVIIAIKSPRKLDHFMPSTEAECRMEVGNTLYIFWLDFEVRFYGFSFLNKF